MTSALTVRHPDRHFTAEAFDEHKLRASLTHFCDSVRSSEGATVDIVERSMKEVLRWLEDKSEVTCDDLRRIAGDTLEFLCPEAGYLYKNEKTMV